MSIKQEDLLNILFFQITYFNIFYIVFFSFYRHTLKFFIIFYYYYYNILAPLVPLVPLAPHLHKSKSEVLVEVRGGEISGHGQCSLGEQLAVLTNLLALEKHLERHLESTMSAGQSLST